MVAKVHVHYHDASGPELRAIQARDFNSGIGMISVSKARLPRDPAPADLERAREVLRRNLNDIQGLLVMLRAMD